MSAITVLNAALTAVLTVVLLAVVGQMAYAAWLGLLAALLGVASGAAGGTAALFCDAALKRRGARSEMRRVMRVVAAGVGGALMAAMLMQAPGMGGDAIAVAALLVLTGVSTALVFNEGPPVAHTPSS